MFLNHSCAFILFPAFKGSIFQVSVYSGSEGCLITFYFVFLLVNEDQKALNHLLWFFCQSLSRYFTDDVSEMAIFEMERMKGEAQPHYCELVFFPPCGGLTGGPGADSM